MNRTIKVASFNINGILNPIKREKILSKLKKDQVQIAFLQELHLDDVEHAKLNKSGFKHVYFSSHRSGRRRGVVILISRTVNFEYISKHRDICTYVLVKGKINLLNVYAPPGSKWDFYRSVFEVMIAKCQGLLIGGGDFNITLNPKNDSSNCKADAGNISKNN